MPMRLISSNQSTQKWSRTLQGLTEQVFRKIQFAQLVSMETPTDPTLDEETRQLLKDFEHEMALVTQGSVEKIIELFRADQSNKYAHLVRLKDLELQFLPGGLRLQSLGVDPGFLLPELKYPESGYITLSLELWSPCVTTFQVFFQTELEPFYSESKSIRRALMVGPNQIRLEINAARLVGQLRVDPGMEEGTYWIRELSVTHVRGLIRAKPESLTRSLLSRVKRSRILKSMRVESTPTAWDRPVAYCPGCIELGWRSQR